MSMGCSQGESKRGSTTRDGGVSAVGLMGAGGLSFDDRADFDGGTESGCGDARSEVDCCLDVGRVVKVVAVERCVCRYGDLIGDVGLAVVDAHGGGATRGLELVPVKYAWEVLECFEFGEDRLLFVGWELADRDVGAIEADLEHVFHVGALPGWG